MRYSISTDHGDSPPPAFAAGIIRKNLPPVRITHRHRRAS
jgi:hypothetical protein